MVEILWKRAFGLILSIIIFMIFNTWLNIIIGIYVYIMLNALKDSQETTQVEFTYFNHSLNMFVLGSKRNNILENIIKMLWDKIDKVAFYERYNKKFNIIMYDKLNIKIFISIKLFK